MDQDRILHRLDSQIDYYRDDLRSRLEILATACTRDIAKIDENGRPDNPLGCVQGRGSEIDRLTGTLCELIAARAELASELKYAAERAGRSA